MHTAQRRLRPPGRKRSPVWSTMAHLARVARVGVPLLALGLLGLSAPASGAASSGFPVTVPGADGSVTLAHRPSAIVSLSPTATEMLYAIGAGKQVKAVDSDSDYPKDAPHTKLQAYSPNVESIVAYKPDLVVEAQDIDGLAASLAKFGIPTLLEPAADDLKQEYDEFTQLGVATGHVAQAASEVAHIRSQISGIVKSVPRSARGHTYYWELDQTYYSATSSTFIGQLLSLLGLHDIADSATGAAASGGYPQLSAEFIIKADPDYIFLADTICCGQSPTTVAKRPGWSALTAVKEHHVVGLNDDIASRWGPRVVILLRDVARALEAGGRT